MSALPDIRSDDADVALSEVWLYTNSDCNLACRHCFVEDRTDRPTLAALLDRAHEAVGLGAETIHITGGEPLLREDAPQLLASLAQEARVCVLTNATLIDSALLAKLDTLGGREWGDRLTFQVSIDGPRHVHDSQRGTGAFDAAIRGIGLLADRTRPPILTTALTSLTVGHAHEVTALAAGLGCRVHQLLLPHRAGRLRCSAEIVPDPAGLLEAIRRCRDVSEATGVVIANDEAIARRVRRPGRFVWCSGGTRTAAIGADGTVYPCPALVGEREFAEAPCGGLRAALSGAAVSGFRRCSVVDRPACAACEYRFMCGGGCGAHAFRSGGSLLADEPYCEVYRGMIEDHLTRESRHLLAGVGDDRLDVGATCSRVPDSESDVVYGCT